MEWVSGCRIHTYSIRHKLCDRLILIGSQRCRTESTSHTVYMLNRVHSTAISSPSGLSIICITTNLSLSSDPFKTGFKNKCMTFWVVTFKQTFTTWHQITWPSSLSLLAVWLTLAALISQCLLPSPPPYSEPPLHAPVPDIVPARNAKFGCFTHPPLAANS